MKNIHCKLVFKKFKKHSSCTQKKVKIRKTVTRKGHQEQGTKRYQNSEFFENFQQKKSGYF